MNTFFTYFKMTSLLLSVTVFTAFLLAYYFFIALPIYVLNYLFYDKAMKISFCLIKPIMMKLRIMVDKEDKSPITPKVKLMMALGIWCAIVTFYLIYLFISVLF